MELVKKDDKMSETRGSGVAADVADQTARGVVPDSRVRSLGESDSVKAHVEAAVVTEDGALIVVGWVYDTEQPTQGFAAIKKNDGKREKDYSVVDLPASNHEVHYLPVNRPDVSGAMGADVDDDQCHGFVVVVLDFPMDHQLALILEDGGYAPLLCTFCYQALEAEAALSQCMASSATELSSALHSALGDSHFLTRSVRSLLITPANVRVMPSGAGDSERIVGSCDGGFALGGAGALIFGWQFSPQHEPLDITVHDEKGNRISVKDRLVRVIRKDVFETYSGQFPNIPRRCGFLLYVPWPTQKNDTRAICFHYPERGDVWLRLPLIEHDAASIQLIKKMLNVIPNPGLHTHYLYELFETGLGAALEAVNQQRLAQARPIDETLESRQFGMPPEAPTSSVIVPLYGRCDFMRHQLAHFADDPDMQASDLIYVVDDTRILEQTLDLAASYQWLFDVPFRVVWYDRNLGFAGANNAGVSQARAERVLLLNSDVIPQQPGWLSTLEQALDESQDAGAVGPLLQFADASTQHAGMHPRRDPKLPGFLVNAHPGMGQQWEGPATPLEQPMLTAACLMLRKRDYDACGGLDEGYVVGDFEDSDLCLNLRTAGQKLYVVPAARLWHLERQSQGLDNVANVRQLITLFNAWRYRQKIDSGALVDPMAIQCGQEQST